MGICLLDKRTLLSLLSCLVLVTANPLPNPNDALLPRDTTISLPKRSIVAPPLPTENLSKRQLDRILQNERREAVPAELTTIAQPIIKREAIDDSTLLNTRQTYPGEEWTAPIPESETPNRKAKRHEPAQDDPEPIENRDLTIIRIAVSVPDDFSPLFDTNSEQPCGTRHRNPRLQPLEPEPERISVVEPVAEEPGSEPADVWDDSCVDAIEGVGILRKDGTWVRCSRRITEETSGVDEEEQHPGLKL